MSGELGLYILPFVGLIFGFIMLAVEALVISLGLAFYVMLATLIVSEFWPKYIKAFKCSFAACVVCFIMTTVIMTGNILGNIKCPEGPKIHGDNIMIYVVVFVLWLLANGWIYSRITTKEGKQIGFFKGFMVNLVSVSAVALTLFGFWCVTGFPFEAFFPFLYVFL